MRFHVHRWWKFKSIIYTVCNPVKRIDRCHYTVGHTDVRIILSLWQLRNSRCRKSSSPPFLAKSSLPSPFPYQEKYGHYHWKQNIGSEMGLYKQILQNSCNLPLVSPHTFTFPRFTTPRSPNPLPLSRHFSTMYSALC